MADEEEENGLVEQLRVATDDDESKVKRNLAQSNINSQSGHAQNGNQGNQEGNQEANQEGRQGNSGIKRGKNDDDNDSDSDNDDEDSNSCEESAIACLDASDCCKKYLCVNSVCVKASSCATLNQSCATKPCCGSGIQCRNETKVCQTPAPSAGCGKQGAMCTTDADCCSPKTCVEGLCSNPNEEPPTEAPVLEETSTPTLEVITPRSQLGFSAVNVPGTAAFLGAFVALAALFIVVRRRARVSNAKYMEQVRKNRKFATRKSLSTFMNQLERNKEECLIDSRRLDLGRIIGFGSHGVVYEGRYHGEQVAVKELVLEEDEDFAKDSRKRFLQEMIALNRLRHPNIIRFIGIGALNTEQEDLELYSSVNSTSAQQQQQRTFFFVMELAKCSLREVMQDDSLRSAISTLPKALAIAQQVCEGLAYMHHMKLIHLDLKPENILLSENGTAKIGDLGLCEIATTNALPPSSSSASTTSASTTTLTAAAPSSPSNNNNNNRIGIVFNNKSKSQQEPIYGSNNKRKQKGAISVDHRPGTAMQSGLQGTSPYIAPELVVDYRTNAPQFEVSFAADVYSFGIVLWELLHAPVPSHPLSWDPYRILVEVKYNNYRPKIDSSIPPKIAELITRCWATNPADRPTMLELAAEWDELIATSASDNAGWNNSSTRTATNDAMLAAVEELRHSRRRELSRSSML